MINSIDRQWKSWHNRVLLSLLDLQAKNPNKIAQEWDDKTDARNLHQKVKGVCEELTELKLIDKYGVDNSDSPQTKFKYKLKINDFLDFWHERNQKEFLLGGLSLEDKEKIKYLFDCGYINFLKLLIISDKDTKKLNIFDALNLLINYNKIKTNISATHPDNIRKEIINKIPFTDELKEVMLTKTQFKNDVSDKIEAFIKSDVDQPKL